MRRRKERQLPTAEILIRSDSEVTLNRRWPQMSQPKKHVSSKLLETFARDKVKRMSMASFVPSKTMETSRQLLRVKLQDTSDRLVELADSATSPARKPRFQAVLARYREEVCAINIDDDDIDDIDDDDEPPKGWPKHWPAPNGPLLLPGVPHLQGPATQFFLSSSNDNDAPPLSSNLDAYLEAEQEDQVVDLLDRDMSSSSSVDNNKEMARRILVDVLPRAQGSALQRSAVAWIRRAARDDDRCRDLIKDGAVRTLLDHLPINDAGTIADGLYALEMMLRCDKEAFQYEELAATDLATRALKQHTHSDVHEAAMALLARLLNRTAEAQCRLEEEEEAPFRRSDQDPHTRRAITASLKAHSGHAFIHHDARTALGTLDALHQFRIHPPVPS